MIKGYIVVGLYRYHAKKPAPSTAAMVIEGPAVKRGQIVELTHMACINYTSANKQPALGIRKADKSDHYLALSRREPSSESRLTGPVYLLPTEKPIGVALNPTANDVIYVSFHGLVYERPKS